VASLQFRADVRRAKLVAAPFVDRTRPGSTFEQANEMPVCTDNPADQHFVAGVD